MTKIEVIEEVFARAKRFLRQRITKAHDALPNEQRELHRDILSGVALLNRDCLDALQEPNGR